MSAVIPFQIVIGGKDSAEYRLHASGLGRSVESLLDLPDLSADSDLLGEALGRSLFPPTVRRLLLDVAQRADQSGARVQVQLRVVVPELATLPWEWISLGGSGAWRPAVRDDYTLMRVARGARPRPTLTLTAPIRLLIACAPNASADSAAALGHALASKVRAGTLVVDLLRDADPVALRNALDDESYHALHIVAADAAGMGSAAYLSFGRSLDATGLSNLLATYNDLRLLTISADQGSEIGAITSVAAAVHERLGLATITLADLDHTQSATFCRPCYDALIAGNPVDLAVTDGRVALDSAGGLWGAPRLWAVPGAERLFVVVPGPTSVPVPRRPSPERMSAPIGRPIRSHQGGEGLIRAPNQPLFRVGATPWGSDPNRWGRQLRIAALVIACLVLILMISQVLPSGQEAEDLPLPSPSPSLPILTPSPLPSPAP
jgi:hypothetical protein